MTHQNASMPKQPATTPADSGVFSDEFVDELSFSYYYHSHTANQLLHALSVPLVYAGILFAVWAAFGPYGSHASLIFISAYVFRFATWDAAAGIAWLLLSLAAHAFLHRQYAALAAAAASTPILSAVPLPLLGVLFSLLCLLAQLLGHVVFEKRLPAFRLFEAAVLTPFLCVLLILFWSSGYRSACIAKTKSVAPKWKGTERHIF